MRSIGIIAVWLLLPLTAAAQFIPNTQSAELRLLPAVPEPNQAVSVTLEAYTIDTTGATIIWFVDGVENTETRNLRNLTLTAKGLGETTTVTAQINLPTGEQITTQQVITPTLLDVVLEGQTLVPAFYQGRPLLTVGSQVRAVAIPYLGDGRQPENFTYIWKLNNNPLYGGPVTGRNVAEFQLGLGRNQILSVDVLGASGQMVAKKSLVLPLVDPEIHFYVKNPLRGIIQRSVQPPFILAGEEVTLRAEPYYMDQNIFSLNPLLEWKVNNDVVESGSTDPLELTLRRTSGSGSSDVSFHIRNLRQLVQGVEQSLRVQF